MIGGSEGSPNGSDHSSMLAHIETILGRWRLRSPAIPGVPESDFYLSWPAPLLVRIHCRAILIAVERIYQLLTIYALTI